MALISLLNFCSTSLNTLALLNSCNKNTPNITLLSLQHEGIVNGAKYHTKLSITPHTWWGYL